MGSAAFLVIQDIADILDSAHFRGIQESVLSTFSSTTRIMEDSKL